MPAAFPVDDSLCERCGYPLKGLSAEQDCPECGLPIAESHPDRRVGLPWQRRVSFGTWLATAREMALHPAAGYRRTRVGGSNGRARLFLLIAVGLVGVVWGAAAVVFFDQPPMHANGEGAIAAVVTLVLTYIEIAGVAYFSRQRGWRIGFATAERVSAYASLGWVPAAAVLLGFRYLETRGHLRFLDLALGWMPFYRLIPYALISGVAMLGFETLVWLGARQVRFANHQDDETRPG